MNRSLHLSVTVMWSNVYIFESEYGLLCFNITQIANDEFFQLFYTLWYYVSQGEVPYLKDRWCQFDGSMVICLWTSAILQVCFHYGGIRGIKKYMQQHHNTVYSLYVNLLVAAYLGWIGISNVFATNRKPDLKNWSVMSDLTLAQIWVKVKLNFVSYLNSVLSEQDRHSKFIGHQYENLCEDSNGDVKLILAQGSRLN